MNTFLITLLNMSLTASYTVLAVLLARFLLKKAPKWVICALWSLVALRLVCPFTIESVLSIIPKADPIPTNIVYDTIPAIDSGIPIVNNVVNPFISHTFAPNLGDSVNPLQVVLFIGGILWILGMACILFYAAIGYLRLNRRLYERAPLQDNIYLCDNIDTPFILGIIKPKIFLPSYLDQSTIDCVVAHEKAHIKRKDHLWKPLGFLLLTVYWFNPLLWVAYKLFCKDMEMACDQKVVATMNTEEIKAYSSALLNCGTVHRNLGVTPLAFGETHVKTRIKSILHYKKPAFWIMMMAVVTCVAIFLCFLTNPKTAITEEETPPDPLVSQPAASSKDAINYDAIEIVADETAPVVFRIGTELWGEAVLDISHIDSVNHCEDENTMNAWLITLTPQGTQIFAKVSRENVGKEITIWLCNTHSYSALIQTELTNGQLLTFPTKENKDFFVNLAWFAKEWLGDSASGYSIPLKNQYQMVQLLHETGDSFRNPGEFQENLTEEMIRLDDGQFYQSYTPFDDRRDVFVNQKEANLNNTEWGFVPIGTANNYSANNIPTAWKKEKEKAEQKYEALLAKQREGYELLVRAPQNTEALTKKQIEQIFMVNLPQQYELKECVFDSDPLLANRPLYSVKILLDDEGLNTLLNGPVTKHYNRQHNKSQISRTDIDKNKVSTWFEHFETLYILEDNEILQTSVQPTFFIMEKDANGKTQVLFDY